MQAGEYQGKDYDYTEGDEFAEEWKISKDPNDLMCKTEYDKIKDPGLRALLKRALDGEIFEDTINPKNERPLEAGTVPYKNFYFSIKYHKDMGTSVFQNTLYTRTESLHRKNQQKMAELYKKKPSMFADPHYQPDFNPERAVGSPEFKDFASGKTDEFPTEEKKREERREDYISDEDKELMKRDVIELRVTAPRYRYCKREIQRWLDRGYEEMSRISLGSGYEVRLKKKEPS